jgi:hypothetical protein
VEKSSGSHRQERTREDAGAGFVRPAFGSQINRQQFIDRISSYPHDITLTRFDASVLTVEPSGDDWVAKIHQKIEYERKGSDGRTEKEYAI